MSHFLLRHRSVDRKSNYGRFARHSKESSCNSRFRLLGPLLKCRKSRYSPMVQRSNDPGRGRKSARRRRPDTASTSMQAGGIPVGRLIYLVADAFGLSSKTVVDDIARMAATPLGGDSDPTRETILSYIKEPRTVVVGEKSVKRRNRLTPIHHKFAHLVINYLDGRRPGRTSIGVAQKTLESSSWREARAVCKRVLRDERGRRFESSLGSDPGTESKIAQIAGVYGVCRRETRDKKYHQEILILRNVGTRKTPRCHCTYVSETVVTRGEWILVGNVIFCNMSGLRADNTHDIAGMYLAYLADDLLSGFLAGPGTDVKIPVAMPVVAVRMAGVNRSIQELGDLGDEAIFSAFRQLKSDLGPISDSLHEILSRQMAPVVFHASDCNPELRHAFDGGRLLIHEQLREFCNASIQ